MRVGRLSLTFVVFAFAALCGSPTAASGTCEAAAEATKAWLIVMLVVPAIINLVSVALIVLTIVHVRRLKRITEAITSSTHWLTRTAVRVGIGPSAKKALLEYAKQKPELSKLVQVPK
ncbi:hypothetical protein L596_025827 [Steinernema carpocapsae]|uniref:Uncharacterized protein n=1 Tax=Steinernema carpocapsae TaxID=34508 RepID=A0A4U5M956_STECR|nr:hypothetical protein L596_025827 [Steinernema carpocapsae]